MLRLLILTIVGIALWGCGEAVVSHGRSGLSGAAGSHADYAASLGAIPVGVVESPFAPTAVITALQSHNPRRLRFTTEPPDSLSSGYRLLLAFDHVPPGGSSVCREPIAARAPATWPGPRPLAVYGAFCLGPVLISDATARTRQIQSAEDVRFHRLMGDLLSALMPLRPPPGGDNR